MRIALVAAVLAQLTPAPANRHATVTASPADVAGKAGAKVSLFVDIVPKPGIHVYAPGAKDYIAVALKLDARPDVKAGRATFPKSEDMFFEPLNEHVPVFQKPFRITQDVTLGKSVAVGSTVTVAGTLSFQACDDKVCYAPESVPVSWSVMVK
ncbi:MAG: protein-disulfide reductase DsbD N-terminal domain-containing protein [Acidobacteriia bacterium]|nr:protein-disulfide reductase DsbD N-terminal domain-containing protein [Terriglobia bacterium]